MAVKKFSQHLHNSAGMRNSFTRATGPDGPLSWFIAALCFLVSLLYSSIYRCSGIFYTSMMTTYGTTRAEASMPFAIYGGFSHLSSLPAGPLIQACGVRFSAFIGGVLISLEFLVSAFATGIPFLIVSIGVLAAGFTAMGGFMTPVMIGFFRDTMGSYDGLLYFMAALLFTSFLLLCCVLITSKKSRS
ncbi:monocarboxylate transporter 12-like [Dermacentor albipictus]|uniref:monocarboxylate transporter 12-like n=1 Tax=Dermacentor albipictus TaxID=60249 RepID=UPI0031FBE316